MYIFMPVFKKMSLFDKYRGVLVDRGIGTGRMVTEAIVKEVRADVIYLFSNGVLHNCSGCLDRTVPQLQGICENLDTSHGFETNLRGIWSKSVSCENDASNILGGLGEFISLDRELRVPVLSTTAANLAKYGAVLVLDGDYIQFESTESVPLTRMSIGPTYVADYIFSEGGANGAYLEYHDLPHFHQPLDTDAAGHLVLCHQKNPLEFAVTAFKIPYGSAIYTPPGIIHNDCWLSGRYNVVYGCSTAYSTVRLRIPVSIDMYNTKNH